MPTRKRKEKPLPPMTLRKKRVAFQRFAKPAYRKLQREKKKVSESDIRNMAYRMYCGL